MSEQSRRSLGLELIGIQDHPYQWRYLDTWSLMADLLARTERIHVFPDAANLPLRGPAMICEAGRVARRPLRRPFRARPRRAPAR